MRLFHDFQAQSWRDYALIPWWMLRYGFALVVTYVWGVWRFIRLRNKVERHWLKFAAFGWGRRESPEPIMCRCCLWAGMVRWTVHTYTACGEDDVEPVDECPRCGSEI